MVIFCLFIVLLFQNVSCQQDGNVKTYYMQAELINWNYLPEGKDVCYGSDHWLETYNKGNKQGEFVKAAYKLYRDDTFQEVVQLSDDMKHAGLLGAVMYAQEGDTINVVFRNTLPFAVNIQPSGVIDVEVNGPPPPVQTNQTVQYTWAVTQQAAPAKIEKSSKFWIFRSNVDLVGHANAGLIGGVVVSKKGQVNEQGKPQDVDMEAFVVFEVQNEGQSSLVDVNFPDGVAEDEDLEFFAINGFIWCNQPIIDIPVGSVARWYVVGVGNEIDVHNAHWHGNVLNMAGRNVDDLIVLPGTNEVLDMSPINPGLWLFHCHVNLHLHNGMISLYRVSGEQPQIDSSGRVRKYFIAADPVEWDYTPSGMNKCPLTPQPFNEDQLIFVEQTDTTMGSKYLKAIYREYTDDTFTQLVERSPEYQHLGMIGPLITAEVGDEIQVFFKNNMDFPTSMHPHGVWYSKSFEGAPYEDGTSGPDKADDAVPTGGLHTYIWKVIPQAGPSDIELSSKLWMYHSHTDEVMDTNAGLMGPIVISNKGVLQDNDLPADVDTQIILFFSVIDEVSSMLFHENILRAFGDNFGYISPKFNQFFLEIMESDDFAESNLMHQINGYMYCNLEGLFTSTGDRLRLHTFALGTEVDMHALTVSGSSVWDGDHPQVATVPMDAGSMVSVDVRPFAQGEWPIQCNIADHIAAGMVAKLQVQGDANQNTATDSKVYRKYYVAAVEEMWDFFPLGYEACTNGSLDEVFVVANENGLGSVYKKAVYREFTDDTFTQLAQESNPFLGLQGPLLEMEVGETIQVIFFNNLTFPTSLDISAGLSSQHNVMQGRQVSAGAKFTYTWNVPQAVGPSEADLSTVIYPYGSATDRVSDMYAGLVGTAIVGRQGSLKNRGQIEGIDLVVPLLFMINNENSSPYLNENIQLTQDAIGTSVNVDSDEFEESNLLHAINGRIYCNLQPIRVTTGQKVRILLLGLGSEADMHGPIFPGQVMLQKDQSGSASFELMPGVATTMDMLITSPGQWTLRCDTHDHYLAGMTASLIVDGEVLIAA